VAVCFLLQALIRFFCVFFVFVFALSHAALVKCRICPHSSVLPFDPSVVSARVLTGADSFAVLVRVVAQMRMELRCS
jgi:hypothetical protein